jgi:uncharacterized protein (TIGR00255 family)
MGASKGGLRSMTGFGAARLAEGGLTLRCEARSVNHRHLVVRVKAPSELGGVDVEIEKRVKARLTRGSVSLNLWLERGDELVAAKIHKELLMRYAAELDAIAEEAGRDDRVSMDRLVALPGVIGAADECAWQDEARALALDAAAAALDDLEVMRGHEGAALEVDLLANCALLEGLMAGVEERMPEVVKAHFEALKKRVSELTDSKPKDEDLARELALLADRHDVSEELTRLASHVAQLEGLLKGAGAIGRKLDFLIQETLREVNTIGSKCNDSAVAHLVVDMKNVVERLREQVQNVE